MSQFLNEWWPWLFRNRSPGGSKPFPTLEIFREACEPGGFFERAYGTHIRGLHYWESGFSYKFFNVSDLANFGNRFISELNETGTKTIETLLRDTEETSDALVMAADALGDAISREEYSHIGNLFELAVRPFWKLGGYAAVPIVGSQALEDRLTNYLFEKLHEKGIAKSKFGDYFTALTDCAVESPLKVSNKSLDAIIAAIGQDTACAALFADSQPQDAPEAIVAGLHQFPAVRTMLEQHTQEYEWVTYKWCGGTSTIADFARQLRHRLVKQPQQKKISLDKERERIISELGIDRQHAAYFDALRGLIHIKEVKTAAMSRACYQLEKFREYVAKEAGISLELTGCMLSDDYRAFLAGRTIDEAELRRREQVFVWSTEQGSIMLSGDAAKRYLEGKLGDLLAAPEQRSYTGTVASPGVVTGTARIVTDARKEGSKIKKGDIIFVPRTTPDYVPYLESGAVVGIVTSERSLAQHATTIARELNIPCIVGATMALFGVEDGEHIRLNKEPGLVEKITKEEHTLTITDKAEPDVATIKFQSSGGTQEYRNASRVIWLHEDYNGSSNERDLGTGGLADGRLNALVGNKAANQIKQYSKHNVPEGFVLTAAFFDDFLRMSGISLEKLADELREMKQDDVLGLQALASTYEERFASVSMPPRLLKIIETAYETLLKRIQDSEKRLGVPFSKSPGQPQLIARSSCRYEDEDASGGSTYAGIYESYGKIGGISNLAAKVILCYASGYSDRALSHMRRQGVNPAENSIPVLVEHQLPAESSGVIYTQHDSKGTTLIEAVRGQCEVLVGGEGGAPDHYELNSQGELATFLPNNQAFGYFPDDKEGFARRELPDRSRILTDAQLYELFRIGRYIEADCGSQQDIEFAIVGPLIFITQNRNFPQLSEVR